MARVFIDGFESGSTDLWDEINGAPAVQAISSGMDGVYQLYCAYQGGHFLRKVLPPAAEYWVAFRYIYVGGSSDYAFTFLDPDGTVLGCIKTDTGVLTAVRGSSTLLASGATAMAAGTAYKVEVRYKPHATAGIFQVKVNGTLEIDYSGNTGTTTNIGKIMLGWTSDFLGEGKWDNIIVDDAEFPGDTMIQARVVNGAGDSTQWTPSTGANYACVDEKPPVDTDYNRGAAADYLDLFAVAALSGAPETIKCVQVQARCKKEGAPPAYLKLAVKTGGTVYLSGDVGAKTGRVMSRYGLWQLNPNTGVDWQPSDALQIGCKAVA
jgi:hypothetical protein